MQWWYVKNGERKGPVETADLKDMVQRGDLGSNDLVWNSSMGQTWKKVSELEELSGREPAAEAAAPAEAAFKPKADLVDTAVKGRPSLARPVESAISGTKKILFKPFDFGKWFALGFSAWLASLMEGGGSSFNFNTGGDEELSGRLGDFMTEAPGFWAEWQGVIISSAAVLILLVFAVGMALVWVRSRGKFMFLDNVVNNRDEVKKPWAEFGQHGNSLFKWMVVYSIIMLAVVLVLLGGAFYGIVLPCIKAKDFLTSTIPAIVIFGLLFTAVAIVHGYILRFLEDFVIPVMYRNNMTVTEAWSFFGKLYGAHTGALILYGLFYFVLALGVGAVVMIATLLTCCILGCLAMIPYVGTVAMLPVFVFFRLYSIHYIAQYGKDFDLVTGAACNEV